MATFFGQYLLEKGVISRDKLLESLASYRENFDSFPNYLVSQGQLSSARAEALLDEVRSSGGSFFDLLVAHNDLSAERVSDARRQYFRENGLGAALLRAGALSVDKLDTEYASFLKRLDELLPWVRPGYLDSRMHLIEQEYGANGMLCPILFSQTSQLLFFLTGVECYLGEVETHCQSLPAAAIDVSLDFRGDLEGVFHLRFPRSAVEEVVRRIPGTRGKSDPLTQVDALQEFLNIVAGAVCAALDEANISLAISPPRHLLPAPALVLTGTQRGIHCPIHVQIAEEAIDTLFLS